MRRGEVRVPIEILHSSQGLRPVMQLGAAMPLHQGAAASIAAPIFDGGSTVAGAVGLSAPALRLPSEQRRVFAPLVREAARRASSALGYAGEPASALGEAV